jgi:hypothetical protein
MNLQEIADEIDGRKEHRRNLLALLQFTEDEIAKLELKRDELKKIGGDDAIRTSLDDSL